MIPKLIMQTGPANLSLILRSAIVNVKLLHPTFDYLFFDDAKVDLFVEQQFPEYRDAYDSFLFPIQRYDFFRYLAVYRYGGFYLDLDVFLAENLTSLLSSECVFPFEELTSIRFLSNRLGMDWQIGNYAFGAEPGHPFLAAIIENCLRANKEYSWVAPMMKGIPKLLHKQFYIFNSTGPGLVSRTYAENPTFADGVNILFPHDVRDPSSWHQFGSFGIHQMSASWRSRPNFLARRLTRLWDEYTLRRILANSRSLGKTRQSWLASRRQDEAVSTVAPHE